MRLQGRGTALIGNGLLLVALGGHVFCPTCATVKPQVLPISLALAVILFGAAISPASGGDASPAWMRLQVLKGTVTFEVDTNLPAVSVQGTSKQFAGRARLRRGPDGLVLEKIEATVPVRALATGIGLRDEHMRARVFATADGRLPDLRFVAETSTCSPETSARHTVCRLSGELAIRDTPRPFAIALKIIEDGEVFRAEGDGVVALSMYGIERPSQFGVTTSDEVKLHLAVRARPTGSGAPATVRATPLNLACE